MFCGWIFFRSEWRGVKSVYHPLVYRVEQVREVVERGGKLIRQKHNWMPFHRAVETGRLDRRTAEYVVRTGGDDDKWGEEVLRLPFSKALAYGLVKVVPLRHCLIEKLPRDKCIFAWSLFNSTLWLQNWMLIQPTPLNLSKLRWIGTLNKLWQGGRHRAIFFSEYNFKITNVDLLI